MTSLPTAIRSGLILRDRRALFVVRQPFPACRSRAEARVARDGQGHVRRPSFLDNVKRLIDFGEEDDRMNME